MKMAALFLAMLLPLLEIEVHDVSMATFRLSEYENGIELNISFDKDDYVRVNKLTDQNIAIDQFQDYLNTTTCWTVNGKKQTIQVETISVKQDHVSATCRTKTTTQPIQKLLVENEFLLDVQDQTNVVVFDLYGKSRGFRMHSGRREIVVTY